MRLFAVTLFAVLALASPALATPVTNVAVDISAPSSAAGARTNYAVTFTTSAAGGLAQTANSRITFVFPSGTTFPGWFGGTVTAGGVAVGNCSSPNVLTVQCSLFSGRTIAAATAVAVRLDGVTNSSPSGARTLGVSTTADTDVVNAPFNVASAGALSNLTVTNTPPSAAAGARTNYVLGFTTSATGGLAQEANSKFDVAFPSGTTFPGWFGGTITVGGVDVGNCSSPSGLTVQCGLFSGRSVAANTAVTITLAGVTNATAGAGKLVTASTTSDPPATNSAPFSVVAAGTLSGVTLNNANPTAAAGARTNYILGLTTSPTGGLAQEANSKLDITFPAGTTFPGWFGGTITVGGVDVGNCSSPNGLTVQCGLFSGRTIAPSTAVTITLAGVTNATAGSGKVVSVSTTSDPGAANSAPFSVVAAGALSAVTLANANPSPAAGARTNYILGFTTSSTGGLGQEANSKLDISFPVGTTFPGWFGGTITVGGVDVGNCSSPNGTTVQCGLFSGRTIAANTAVTITLAGVTNATAGAKVVAVSTTSDPAAANSAPFNVAVAGTLSGVTVAVSSLTPSARTRYVVRFTASATGGLAQVANSRFDLTLPAGTTFAGWSGGTVHDDTSGLDVGNCSSPNGLAIQCGLFSGRTVGAGDSVRITFDNITNPAATGPQQLKVSTTSDPAAVTSGDYSAGEPLPADTTIDSGTTSAAGATFAFSAAEPGSSFECRIDDAPFSACSSPYTTPALPPGPHTFQVRALDAAGNPDPSPPSRGFTVEGGATPTPVPTTAPTPISTVRPTPAPAPEFRQDVVVAPVSGIVEVCDKPGVNCRRLAGGAEIPLNSTVDARKGVVVLSSVTAGGVVQTAKFYDGMFKVTQSATTTDLTLNEPLAPCGKRKQARAAAKKPKSRRLWGDGKGTFRTRGQYAAATVRGTKWLVQDTCDGTLVRVTQGVVSARDEVAKKTVTLRAGKRYTAKPRRR